MKACHSFLIAALMGGISCTSVWRAPGTETLPQANLGALEIDRGEHPVASIRDIDGQPRGTGRFNRYELTPGRHAFTVKLLSHQRTGSPYTRFKARPVVLHLDVIAGRVYQFKSEMDQDTSEWRAWIEDKSSHKRVDY